LLALAAPSALSFSRCRAQLASGGNDNKLLVWNMHAHSPVLRFNDHTAAVKVQGRTARAPAPRARVRD
jgi:hypothetical protein